MVAFSLPAGRSYDNPHSIAVLILFLLAAFVTIRPVAIPISIPRFVPKILHRLRLRDNQLPLKKETYCFHIDLNVGPIAAVLILLASKSIGIIEFRAGIKGLGGVHPYDILLLFLSLVNVSHVDFLMVLITAGLHSHFIGCNRRPKISSIFSC